MKINPLVLFSLWCAPMLASYGACPLSVVLIQSSEQATTCGVQYEDKSGDCRVDVLSEEACAGNQEALNSEAPWYERVCNSVSNTVSSCRQAVNNTLDSCGQAISNAAENCKQAVTGWISNKLDNLSNGSLPDIRRNL